MSSHTYEIRDDWNRRLQSATQYPSIETYHKLGQRGVFDGTVQVDFAGDYEGGNGYLYMTEKLDGCNARIILSPDRDWWIGQRTGLLASQGDRVVNEDNGIVRTLREIADSLVLPTAAAHDEWIVIFGEVFGKGAGAKGGKQYGGDRLDFRVFDIAYFDPEILTRRVEDIAAWRQDGGQNWLDYHQLAMTCRGYLKTVPFIEVVEPLPTGIEETHQWLAKHATFTAVELGDDGGRRAEGVVLRTVTRSLIAKLRHENYERTARLAVSCSAS